MPSFAYLSDRLRRSIGRPPKRAWPGWPGSAVRANGLHKAGTLGCYVRCKNKGTVYALTCEHVLTDNAHPPPIGTVVRSYALPDVQNEIELGIVERILTAETGVPLDAVLIRLRDQHRAVNCVPQVGFLSSQVPTFQDLPLRARVCKFGAASQYSRGLITAVTSIRQERSDERTDRFSGVMEVTPEFDTTLRCTSFCSRGDSGSVLIVPSPNGERFAAGLLIARGTLLERGYVQSLAQILELSNTEMI